jgi:hypothetical protein
MYVHVHYTCTEGSCPEAQVEQTSRVGSSVAVTAASESSTRQQLIQIQTSPKSNPFVSRSIFAFRPRPRPRLPLRLVLVQSCLQPSVLVPGP